jgi:crooked neck
MPGESLPVTPSSSFFQVKVWLSLASFEASQTGGDDSARAVYEQGYSALKAQGSDAGEHRAMLVDAWRLFEGARLAEVREQLSRLDDGKQSQNQGGELLCDAVARAEARVAAVVAKAPQRLVKRRPGKEGGAAEEYVVYVFPDDEVKPAHLKLLEMAQKWKQQQQQMQASADDLQVSGEGGGDANEVDIGGNEGGSTFSSPISADAAGEQPRDAKRQRV